MNGGQILKRDGQTPETPEHPSVRPRSSEEEEPSERLCRICFSGEEEDEDSSVSPEHLISPCMCRGSMRYVHLSCLTQWRQASANPRSFFECDNCKYRYRLSRTRLSLIMRSAVVLYIVAALIVVVLVILSSLLSSLVLMWWDEPGVPWFAFDWLHLTRGNQNEPYDPNQN